MYNWSTKHCNLSSLRIQFLRSIGNFSNGHHFSPYMRYVEIHWDTCLHCVCVTAASLYPLLNQNCIHASFTSRIGEGWLLIFTISGLIQRNIWTSEMGKDYQLVRPICLIIFPSCFMTDREMVGLIGGDFLNPADLCHTPNRA